MSVLIDLIVPWKSLISSSKPSNVNFEINRKSNFVTRGKARISCEWQFGGAFDKSCWKLKNNEDLDGWIHKQAMNPVGCYPILKRPVARPSRGWSVKSSLFCTTPLSGWVSRDLWGWLGEAWKDLSPLRESGIHHRRFEIRGQSGAIGWRPNGSFFKWWQLECKELNADWWIWCSERTKRNRKK